MEGAGGRRSGMRSPQLVPQTCPLIFWLGSGCFLINHLEVSQVVSQLAELGLKRGFFKWIFIGLSPKLLKVGA